MENILFLCSDYLDDTDASGICTKNLVLEMIAKGYNVNVISDSKDKEETIIEDGVTIYKIKSPFFSRIKNKIKKRGFFSRFLLRIICVLRYGFTFFIYPNVSPVRALKVKKVMFDIIEKKRIDTIIGMYRPYESIEAVMAAKKRYGDNIKAITYHLDLIQSPSNKNDFIKKYKQFLGEMAISKELELVDLMLLPESADLKYKNHAKVKCVDFPLYIKKEPMVYDKVFFSDNEINIVYMGSLDQDNRNPKYILDLLDMVSKRIKKKVFLNIWGNLSDIETKKIIDKYTFVKYHGIVQNKYVLYILNKSDFILNIGNKITYNMIPSKIFQIFSTNRPIINCVKNMNDSSVVYFEKYGHFINIEEYKKNESAIDKVVDFINQYENKSFNVSEELFKKSTPGYIIDLIAENL